MSGMSAQGSSTEPVSAAGGRTSVTPVGTADAGAQRASDAARVSTGQDMQQPPTSVEEDAGKDDSAPGMTGMPSSAQDAGVTTQPREPEDPTQPTTPGSTTPATANVPAECTRAALRTKADAYMQALVAGNPNTLRLHPSVRYTENGQEQALGAGVWLRGPRIDFARHIFDEVRCSSITQAALSAVTGATVLGVRLLYRDGQLLEVEAHVVPEALTRIDVDMIIPIGNDRFVEPVVEERRMSREQLEAFADRYFDAAVNGGEVPPSAPDCRRRQNGVPLGDGTCSGPPGTMRFEQRRYPVLDELAGIITASVIYDNHVGLYLIKMAGGSVQSIEVVGGATAESSGW